MSKISKIIITSLVHMLFPISLGFNASFYCSSSEQPEQTCLTGISSFLTSFLPRSFLSPTDPTKPESTDAALRIFCINNPDYSISSEGMSSPEVIDLLQPFKEYLNQISRDPNVKQSLDNYNSAVEKEIQSLDTFISKLENGHSKYEATQVFNEFLGNEFLGDEIKRRQEIGFFITNSNLNVFLKRAHSNSIDQTPELFEIFELLDTFIKNHQNAIASKKALEGTLEDKKLLDAFNEKKEALGKYYRE